MIVKETEWYLLNSEVDDWPLEKLLPVLPAIEAYRKEKLTDCTDVRIHSIEKSPTSWGQ